MIKNFLLISSAVAMLSSHSYGMDSFEFLQQAKAAMAARPKEAPKPKPSPAAGKDASPIKTTPTKPAPKVSSAPRTPDKKMVLAEESKDLGLILSSLGEFKSDKAYPKDVPSRRTQKTNEIVAGIEDARKSFGIGGDSLAEEVKILNTQLLGGQEYTSTLARITEISSSVMNGNDPVLEKIENLSVAIAPGNQSLAKKVQSVKASIRIAPSGETILEDQEALNKQIVDPHTRDFVLESSIQTVSEKIGLGDDSSGVLSTDIDTVQDLIMQSAVKKSPTTLVQDVRRITGIVSHIPQESAFSAFINIHEAVDPHARNLRMGIDDLVDALYKKNPSKQLSEFTTVPEHRIILERIIANDGARAILNDVVSKADIKAAFEAMKTDEDKKKTIFYAAQHNDTLKFLDDLIDAVAGNHEEDILKGAFTNPPGTPSLAELIGDPSGDSDTTGLSRLVKNDSKKLGKDLNGTGYTAKAYDRAQTLLDQIQEFINVFNQAGPGITIPQLGGGANYESLSDILRAVQNAKP